MNSDVEEISGGKKNFLEEIIIISCKELGEIDPNHLLALLTGISIKTINSFNESTRGIALCDFKHAVNIGVDKSNYLCGKYLAYIFFTLFLLLFGMCIGFLLSKQFN
jgi:hypothetical protein